MHLTLKSMRTLFQTCLIVSSLVQTDFKGIVKGFVDGLIDEDERVVSSLKHTHIKTRVQGALFMTKTSEKLYPLGPHIPI